MAHLEGWVDDYGRPLVRIPLAHPGMPSSGEWDGWIDTGCTGVLLLPQEIIQTLGLAQVGATQARMADGSERELPNYLCLIFWFGQWLQVEALATSSKLPLIGLRLLQDCTLAIDYPKRAVTISSNS